MLVVSALLLQATSISTGEGGRQTHVTGSTEPILVILAQLPNAPTNRFVQTDETYWAEIFMGPKPSVTDYFYTVSYGLVNLTAADEQYGIRNNGVVGWLVFDESFDEFEGNEYAVAIARAALIKSDPYVNYHQFDLDDNGYLETQELHIYVIASAYERSFRPSTESLQVKRISFHFAEPGSGSSQTPISLDGTIIGADNHAKISITGEMLRQVDLNGDSPVKVGY